MGAVRSFQLWRQVITRATVGCRKDQHQSLAPILLQCQLSPADPREAKSRGWSARPETVAIDVTLGERAIAFVYVVAVPGVSG
jgi:hypothetical protein